MIFTQANTVYDLDGFNDDDPEYFDLNFNKDIQIFGRCGTRSDHLKFGDYKLEITDLNKKRKKIGHGAQA